MASYFKYYVSGYDNDNDIFTDYLKTDSYESACTVFEELKEQLHANALRSELGELMDFIAIYDIETNDRLDVEYAIAVNGSYK